MFYGHMKRETFYVCKLDTFKKKMEEIGIARKNDIILKVCNIWEPS